MFMPMLQHKQERTPSWLGWDHSQALNLTYVTSICRTSSIKCCKEYHHHKAVVQAPSNVPYLETPSSLHFFICSTEVHFKTNAVLICCRHWRPTCISVEEYVLIGVWRQSICHDTVKRLTDSYECLWHRISIHSLAGTIHLPDKTKISYTAGLLFMINKW